MHGDRQTQGLAILYLGRGHGIARFALELAQNAHYEPNMSISLILSSSNPLRHKFKDIAIPVTYIATMKRPFFPSVATRFPLARRNLLRHLDVLRPLAVVSLMPHVWTPLLVRSIRRRGIKYVSTIHDAYPHPGDPTAILTRWLLEEARAANCTISLSRTVADQLERRIGLPPDRILRLFHPDLTYGAALPPRKGDAVRPLRILFFGRIMRYKGLELLIDAVERLRGHGTHVHLGVAGHGELGRNAARLRRLGAEVINRWIEDYEVVALLARHDAMACSYIEASQSGVASMAFGNGMPVIATPVGGLTEQVIDGRTGLLAREATEEAYAEAIARLAGDADLYRRMSAHLTETSEERSMRRFLAAIVRSLLEMKPQRSSKRGWLKRAVGAG